MLSQQGTAVCAAQQAEVVAALTLPSHLCRVELRQLHYLEHIDRRATGVVQCQRIAAGSSIRGPEHDHRAAVFEVVDPLASRDELSHRILGGAPEAYANRRNGRGGVARLFILVLVEGVHIVKPNT